MCAQDVVVSMFSTFNCVKMTARTRMGFNTSSGAGFGLRAENWYLAWLIPVHHGLATLAITGY